MKRILVVYYSQSGQLRNIAKSVLSPVVADANIVVDYYKINVVDDYPFPWTSDAFFDVMPESVKNIAVDIDLRGFPLHNDYDLVVLAYQVWYLSPSIPFNSFLSSDLAKEFLAGKQLVCLLGVRNMWVVAHEYVEKQLNSYGAHVAATITLADQASNLVSVITIIKWLVGGNKKPYKLLPEAGVSEESIRLASRFGESIRKAVIADDYGSLQEELSPLSPAKKRYHLVRIERTASRIFNAWASIIRKKGGPKSKDRLFFVRLFKYYLLFVIFVVSPVVSVFFRTTGAIKHLFKP